MTGETKDGAAGRGETLSGSAGEEDTTGRGEDGGGLPLNLECMMLICCRPRHRETGYRLAADGVTELAAPPGRSLPSDATGVGAACARF